MGRGKNLVYSINRAHLRTAPLTKQHWVRLHHRERGEQEGRREEEGERERGKGKGERERKEREREGREEELHTLSLGREASPCY